MLLDWHMLLVRVCSPPRRACHGGEGVVPPGGHVSLLSANRFRLLSGTVVGPVSCGLCQAQPHRGSSDHTIRGVQGWRSPSSIGKVDRGGHSRLIADDARGVPFARQVLCQIHMTGTEAVHAAIGEADLHFPL
jgi:hypothetical protein